MDTGPKWYITRGQQRIGPVDAAQLRHMAENDQLQPTEYVWREGMAQWVQAGQVQGLFAAPATSVPSTHDAAAQPPSPTPADSAPVTTPTAPVTPTATPVAAPVAPTPAVSRPSTAAKPPVAVALDTTSTPIRPSAPIKAYTGDILLPILAGIMLMATILIPWGAFEEYAFGPKKTVFSWQIIKVHFSDGGEPVFAVWLLAAWITGLLALILTPLTRGINRATVALLTGIVCAALFIVVAIKTAGGETLFKSGASELEQPLSLVLGLLTFLALVFAHITRRGGYNTPLRVIQIILCIALVASAITLLITGLTAANNLWTLYGPRRVKQPWSMLLRVNLLVEYIGVILAGLFLLLNAFTARQRGAFSILGLLILYLVTFATTLLDLLTEAGVSTKWNELSAGINGVLIVLGTAIILGCGIVQMVSQIRRTA